MEDYGYYHKRPRQRSAPGSALLRTADVIILIMTILCSVLLIAACVSRYVDPRRAWVFAFPGLVFPILYMAEIVFGLWWIVRWKKYALVVAVLLILGIGAAGAFYRPDLSKHYAEQPPSNSELVVMSYNVMGFNSMFNSADSTVRELTAALIIKNNVDIVCFQEFGGNLDKPEISSLIPDLKYKAVNTYNSDDSKATYYSGLAIYSRYPILDSGLLPSKEDDRNFAMWADIRVRRDTVRVFDVHLNSTYIDNDDIDYLSGFRFVSENRRRARIGEIVRKLRESYMRRAPQAVALSQHISESPYPVIVCGDFNDTPASFAYHRVSRGMQDAFVEKGRGGAGTYNGFFNMFRIDYILFSRGVEVTNYYAFDQVYSDHEPVAAGFEFSSLK